MSETSYITGETVSLGDIVELGVREGRIVACMETGQYSPEFPEEEWAYLEKGILWEGADRGIIHVPSLSDPDVVFIKRKHEDK